MTLDELQAEADKDLVIDDTELDTESLRTPILHNKYLQYYNKFNLLLKKSQWEEKTLQREKWNTIQVNLTLKYIKKNHLI